MEQTSFFFTQSSFSLFPRLLVFFSRLLVLFFSSSSPLFSSSSLSSTLGTSMVPAAAPVSHGCYGTGRHVRAREGPLQEHARASDPGGVEGRAGAGWREAELRGGAGAELLGEEAANLEAAGGPERGEGLHPPGHRFRLRRGGQHHSFLGAPLRPSRGLASPPGALPPPPPPFTLLQFLGAPLRPSHGRASPPGALPPPPSPPPPPVVTPTITP